MEPVSMQLKVLIIKDISLATHRYLAVFATHVTDLTSQRVLRVALLSVEAMVLRVSQLDECWVPAITSSSTP